MIVGFPGETAAEFDETLTLTAAVRFHSMFSFKYSPRPNTLADKRLVDNVTRTRRHGGSSRCRRCSGRFSQR
jgi:tRNA-2-methylthio-N6-dimethylallyladenosine synthase